MGVANPYEYKVKTRLMQIGKTQEWLAQEVAKRNGGYMDGQYLGKIIKGKANSPKTVKAINEILGIKIGKKKQEEEK